MTTFNSSESCPECSRETVELWRDLDINPEIKAYRDAYISPPKMFYLSLEAAMRAHKDIDMDGFTL